MYIPGDENVQHNCSTNCYSTQIPYGFSISSHGGDDEQEIESDDKLDKEGLGYADVGNGESTGKKRVVDEFKNVGGGYGSDDLYGDISRNLNPREFTEGCEGNRNRWVEMCTGDVTS